jgi:hypothetical protein
MDKDPWIIFGLMEKHSRRFPQLYKEAMDLWRLSPNKAFVITMASIARELYRRMENCKWRMERECLAD